MVPLSTLKKTKGHLFDWVWAQLVDALTLGRAWSHMGGYAKSLVQ